MSTSENPYVTVLFPCLNEEGSIEAVTAAAQTGLADAGLEGEILVSDNGSSDRSVEIALSQGARVINSSPQGYGAAYICGIEAAKGDVIVMADADMTYPLDRIGDFVSACRASEMAIGIRETDAQNMPMLNRVVGNPVLSGLARFMFSSTVADFHCGMRAIRREAANRLDLKTTGMEFASEMVILALQAGYRIEELPIAYSARVGESKLDRWRDGWRHVKFLLAHSPDRLFLYPGVVLGLVGLIGTIAFIPGPLELAGRPWFIHAQLVFVALWLVGLQMISLGWLARGLERVSKPSPRARNLIDISMEWAQTIGLLLAIVGLITISLTMLTWGLEGAGALRGSYTLVAGIALLIGGLQMIATAWFRAMLDVSIKSSQTSFSELAPFLERDEPVKTQPPERSSATEIVRHSDQ